MLAASATATVGFLASMMKQPVSAGCTDGEERVMQYTRLGTSGLQISRIALGCMSFGDTSQMPWALDDEGAEPIFRQAVESGITFWVRARGMFGRTVWLRPRPPRCP
ncbi:hypothetical protein [Streptomyces umbrinus]|uniref:hypothetical protein n=1 Tax=Streptomyces umbrinus TaxID=67370 RepID=UPI0034235120